MADLVIMVGVLSFVAGVLVGVLGELQQEEP